MAAAGLSPSEPPVWQGTSYERRWSMALTPSGIAAANSCVHTTGNKGEGHAYLNLTEEYNT
eukprot:8170-Heterococcus_DN1.PRE.2